jgi:hypothetical protein
LRRLSDGKISIVIVAEVCDDCYTRVRYWNDPDGSTGNATCNCCPEGPEACDLIPMRPQVAALLREVLEQIDRDARGASSPTGKAR